MPPHIATYDRKFLVPCLVPNLKCVNTRYTLFKFGLLSYIVVGPTTILNPKKFKVKLKLFFYIYQCPLMPMSSPKLPCENT